MMSNSHIEIAAVLQAIGNRESIAGVIIFNKRGEIMHSVNPTEIGRTALSAMRRRRNSRLKTKPKKQTQIEFLKRSRMDLHIQKVADKMGGKRGAGHSLGVATYPEDLAEGQGLIHKADEALYAAKRAGRDRVFGA